MSKQNNLQLFPKAVRVKAVILDFEKTSTGDIYFFFPYDASLDNCLLKGLRVEFDDVTSKQQNTYSPYKLLNLTTAVNFSLLLNVVNQNDERVISEYPISALGIDTNYIRRYNIENVNWGKSYIHFADGSFVAGKLRMLLTVYYTDKK